MTPFEGVLLLLGIFGVPTGLLALSHRFRDLGRRPRGAFWGGLFGWTVGMGVWVAATLGPVVMWDPGSARLAGVVLPLFGFALVGALLGAAIGRTPRRGPKAPGRRKRRAKPPSEEAPDQAGEATKQVGQVVAAVVLLLVAAAPATSQEPDELFVVREIDAGVIIAETAPGVPASAYASSVAVLGSDGVLLVDTFHGPAAADWFLDRIAERTDVPVRWVVNTHRHGDHVWGNAAVLERFPSAEILAHPATIEWLTSEGAGALDQERERLDGRIAAIEAQLAEVPADDARRPEGEALLARARAQRLEVERVELTPPTEAVPDFRRIDVGSRTVWVQPLAPAHTDGDVVVWIDGVLVAGDVLEEGLLWIEGADISGWARTLSELADRGPALAIPSHGGLPESIDRAALLHLQRDVMSRVVATALLGRAEGEIDLAGFADLRDRFAEWGVGGEAFDAWVLRAVEVAR
jgi:glyoxylase-like metal-dependent hydrolase (beta-lactamase superfamily II)